MSKLYFILPALLAIPSIHAAIIASDVFVVPTPPVQTDCCNVEMDFWFDYALQGDGIWLLSAGSGHALHFDSLDLGHGFFSFADVGLVSLWCYPCTGEDLKGDGAIFFSYPIGTDLTQLGGVPIMLSVDDRGILWASAATQTTLDPPQDVPEPSMLFPLIGILLLCFYIKAFPQWSIRSLVFLASALPNLSAARLQLAGVQKQKRRRAPLRARRLCCGAGCYCYPRSRLAGAGTPGSPFAPGGPGGPTAVFTPTEPFANCPH